MINGLWLSLGYGFRYSRSGDRVTEWMVRDFRDSVVFWSRLHRPRMSHPNHLATRRHIPEERRLDDELATALKDVWSTLPLCDRMAFLQLPNTKNVAEWMPYCLGVVCGLRLQKSPQIGLGLNWMPFSTLCTHSSSITIKITSVSAFRQHYPEKRIFLLH